MINATVARYFSPAILQTAGAFYGIDVSKAKLIKGYSNLIYDCGDKFLRLSHSAIRPYEEIMGEIAWLGYLSTTELPVVTIVPTLAGEQLERIGGIDHFTVVCFEAIEGIAPGEAQWNEALFEKLGVLTGRLHRQEALFKAERPAADYQEWHQIPEHHCGDFLVTEDYDYRTLYQQLTKMMLAYPITESNYGLVHYDIHHGNYLLQGEANNLMLLDFEMACKSWFMNDVAILVYYANRHPAARNEADFIARFLPPFWKGYERHWKIEEAEKKWLPTLLLYRDLLVLGFINKQYRGMPLTEKDHNFRSSILASIKQRTEQFGVKK